MAWETPVVEDVSCGMEVTAYLPATETAIETAAESD